RRRRRLLLRDAGDPRSLRPGPRHARRPRGGRAQRRRHPRTAHGIRPGRHLMTDLTWSPRPSWARLLRAEQVPLLVALLLICAYMAIATNGLFLTPGNVLNVLRASSIELIVALGMTVAMISGQIDLSVGSM